MRITDVTAGTYDVPVEVPLLSDPVDTTIVIATVETADGRVGYGETGYLNPAPTARFVENEVGPLLKGADPFETGAIVERLDRTLNPRAGTGVFSTAVSAVDVALWDLKGKYIGEPVWRLLGGAGDPLPAYVTFGLPEFDEGQLRETAGHLVDEGHDKLKMVVAASAQPDLAYDAARVEAVREAVGEEVHLAIDANYGLSVDEALDLCGRLEDVGLRWIEEPVYGNDPARLADLRRRTRVPIAAGQNEGNLARHRQLIEGGAVDVALPNACFVGGFTQGVKAAAIAEASNLSAGHGGGWPFQNVHLQAGIANSWWMEYHYLHWLLGEEIYRSVPTPEAGTVTPPDDPGLGLEPDWDRLERYAST